MKEPHSEGVAHHTDPLPCGYVQEDMLEALAGAHAGQPLSCDIRKTGTPTLLNVAEGNTDGSNMRKLPSGPAQSKTLCMHGNSVHGNWEIPQAPGPDGSPGRSAKANGRTADMNACGKSDGCIVPGKSANNGEQSPAERMEGRRPTEGNDFETSTLRAQDRAGVPRGLEGVRQAAKKDKDTRFTSLLHHVSRSRLREAFFALKREAAPGVDKMTWSEYEKDLEARIQDLCDRVHRGSYRALPSRRVYIPKADGRMRPLGVTSLEDKIVQQAVTQVLNAVYEQDFLGFSYGFRPGRSQHDALDALSIALRRKKVNWVLDADIQGFFDTISHEWMMKFLKHRIADRRLLRLVRKWLRAGVCEKGEWSQTKMGTPQGAVISPLLANIYLHYVLDLWVQQWRRRHAKGDMVVVRYADDFVLGFQHRQEAERFLRDLGRRLKQFRLSLHPDKTRLIEFGRFAARNRKERGERKPETFDFLGFTHMVATSKDGNWFFVRRKTVTKRLRAKLKELRGQLLRWRHEGIRRVGKWLGSVVRGYFNYHAIPGNMPALETFRREVCRSWLHALRRRGQHGRMNWEKFNRVADHWVPKPKILHPNPNVRFDAKHLR